MLMTTYQLLKKVILASLILSTKPLFTQGSQLNNDFQKRFGPDSAPYNTPLYFSVKQMRTHNKSKKLRHKNKISLNQHTNYRRTQSKEKLQRDILS